MIESLFLAVVQGIEGNWTELVAVSTATAIVGLCAWLAGRWARGEEVINDDRD